MDFRLLGPLEIQDGDGPLPAGGPKQRALLAFLLLHPNEIVSADRLIDELWGEGAPRTAKAVLRNQVLRLRRVLDPERLVTRGSGYVLCVHPNELDLDRFERLVGRAGDMTGEERSAKLSEALSLWRGPPLADLAFEPFARAETERLEELRLAVLEERIDCDLTLGRHPELVAELKALVARHPLRERLWGQLMLALYRSERQVEALIVYRDARRMFVENLGVEPGEKLRRLEQAVLAQDSALDLERPFDGASPEDVFERAASLVSGNERRIELLHELGVALWRLGQVPSADALLTSAMRQAAEAGDASSAMKARLARSAQRVFLGRETQAGLLETAEQAVALFGSLGDEGGLARAWAQIGHVRRTLGPTAASSRAYRSAIAHAQAARDHDQERRILGNLVQNFVYGPTPVPNAISRCEEVLDRLGSDRVGQARLFQCLALLHAMGGRFEEGRLLCARSKAIFQEFALKQLLGSVCLASGPLELLAGDPEAAEGELRAGHNILRAIGDEGVLPQVVSLLAHALHLQARDEEAEQWARLGEELSAEDDLWNQLEWRAARASALAGLGVLREAEDIARRAVALAEPTDWLNVRGNTLMTLAGVLRTAGRGEDASATIRSAVRLYQRKGNLVAAKAARSFLAAPRA